MAKALPNLISSSPWWQFVTWIADPLKFQIAYRRKYGDVFTMTLGSFGRYVVVGNPQMIQEIFNQDSQFDIGRGNFLAEPLIGEKSLMLMDGDRHRRERKLLMPPFHGERLQTYAHQICQVSKAVANRWTVNQPFVARTAMQTVSLEVILQVVFGISEGDRYEQLKPLLTEWLNMTDSPLRSSILFFPFLQKDWGDWSPWGQMERRKKQVYQLLKDEIDERRSQDNKPATDVLSLMMAARDEAGQAMADKELQDELLTILFAGHETTATTLAWAFYQIHQCPQVREKLLQELDSLDDCASPMELAKLPYLNAVCQETLRMYPVLPIIFPRITKAPMQIAGYSLEPETVLMPSIFLVHYREELYPEPEEFRPERFLERQFSPSEYLPFGGGSRRCLGYALALLEMKLVLATVLSRCELALAENQPVKSQRRGFTLAPATGVRMMLTGRRNPAKVGVAAQ